ncbi:MAG TPA: GAF domain-containing protein [Chryseosolibacter sp.]|nr:GAF domain-containing protein [Chryseosolibacter sp.]
MTELLRDRYKVGLALAALFILGVIISLYSVYSIPHRLMIGNAFHPGMASTYIILLLTFISGGVALWYSLGYKNEVIVFRDKVTITDDNDQSQGNSSQTTISLENVRTSINQANGAEKVLRAGLEAICKQLDAGQGAVYLSMEEESGRRLELKGGYALSIGENTVISFAYGEGLVGQAASGARTLYIDEVPEGYIKIISGLGSASPRFLLIVPIKKAEKVFGIIEIASFTAVSEDQRKFVEESAQLIADVIATK